MITQTYTCDWCKLLIDPETGWGLSLATFSYSKRLKQEICDACRTKLARWIESQTDDGEDGGILVPKPEGPNPGLSSAETILHYVEQGFNK